MTKGLKIWLYFILVVNVFATCVLAIGSVLLNDPISFIILVLYIVDIIGIILLLFKKKKLGFYIMVIFATVGLITNLVTGKNNIIIVVISTLLAPIITYLLMRKNWIEFK